MLKTKEKKTSFECVHDLSWRSHGKKRDNLHLPNLGMICCTKTSTVSPIQVTRNKAITYSYAIWDSVSLDTGFLATAVKNLWVVLSFNARKAIPHNTGLINNVATSISTIIICICDQKGLHAVQFGNNWMKKIRRTAKIGWGRRSSSVWLSEECFEFNYLQIREACSPVTY